MPLVDEVCAFLFYRAFSKHLSAGDISQKHKALLVWQKANARMELAVSLFWHPTIFALLQDLVCAYFPLYRPILEPPGSFQN
jgi:hypothetical protein